jgi:uncharacterized membrane protein
MNKILAGMFAVAGLVSTQVYAAVPLAVTTAMDDAKADAIAIGTAALIIVFAIAAFKYMKSAK